MSVDNDDTAYETIVMVTRGDERPKKNYEKKTHPTYETSIRIRSASNHHTVCQPHVVCKFFDQYRTLSEELTELGVGDEQIEAEFPPTLKSSAIGMSMTEVQLQQRCYLLNKWMKSILAHFPELSSQAQKLISEFLSLEDGDADSEANKELILSLIMKNQTKRTNSKSSRTQQTLLLGVQRNGEGESAHMSLRANESGKFNNSKNNRSANDNVSGEPSYKGISISAKASVATTSSNSLSDMDGGATERNSKKAPPPPSSASSAHSAVSSDQDEWVVGKQAQSHPQESIVNGWIAVGVSSIEDQQQDGEIQYETIVRILPYTDINVPNKADIDPNKYTATFGNLPPLRVIGTYERYRSLKDELTEQGVFTRKDRPDALAYNERMSQFYNITLNDAIDGNGQAIILDCDFPRVYRRSSLGFSLSKEHLYDRLVLLNHWMGNLLQHFYHFIPSAQEKIADFLGLIFKELHINDHDSYNLTYVNLSDSVNYSKVFLLMLRNKFTPQKQLSKSNNDTLLSSQLEKKDRKKSTSFSEHPNSLGTITVKDAILLSEGGINEAVVISGILLDIEEESKYNSVNATTMTAERLITLSKETIIYSFLGVKIRMGDLVSKGENESKSHPGYEIVIRILPFMEVDYMEKDRVDIDTYNRMQISMKPFMIIKPFALYRTFRKELENYGVYCSNRVPSNFSKKLDSSRRLSNGHTIVILDAFFPKTYQRSSFGLKLSDKQLQTRSALLNRWFGIILSRFHAFCPEVQNAICRFLTIPNSNSYDKDIPTHIIAAMLHRRYVPPMRVIVFTKVQGKNKKRMSILKAVSTKFEDPNDENKDAVGDNDSVGAPSEASGASNSKSKSKRRISTDASSNPDKKCIIA